RRATIASSHRTTPNAYSREDHAADIRKLPPPGRAARAPDPRLRRAGARRAALHRDPPGLRAVVQGDAPRDGAPPVAPRIGRHRPGAAHLQADPHDPEGP